MKLKSFLINIAFLTLATLLLTFNANAQYGQYGGYGGSTPSQSILVDKLVGLPTAATKGGTSNIKYVDNLSSVDFKFQPNQEVFFQIKVKNTSNNTLTNVVLKDFLPQFADAKEGPGTINNASKTITVNIGNLNSGEEKVFTLKTQILTQDKLPANQGLFCMINKAEATADNNIQDDDSSQFCVEKQVVGVTTVPSAGPELGPMLLAGELAILGTGLFLKRKRS